ncbi:MAG: EAL domain-containing protein [Plesiomonas sp.]|uniref:EAL domain-containing protein n=1 Tax=Plesiomonas sp. TaxID=2486279 RepID=UPI003F379B42
MHYLLIMIRVFSESELKSIGLHAFDKFDGMHSMNTLCRALLYRLTLLLIVLCTALMLAIFLLIKYVLIQPESVVFHKTTESDFFESTFILPSLSFHYIEPIIDDESKKALTLRGKEELSGTFNFLLLWLALFSTVFIIITVVVYRIFLQKILKPLYELVENLPMFFIHHIEGGDSKLYNSQSNIKEFSAISLAFNKMQQKYICEFNAQIEEISRLHREAYQDVTTHLANRRWFRQQLDTASHEGVAGVLFIIDLEKLSYYYETISNQDADRISLRIATLLREQCATYPNALIARTRLAEFAIWCPRLLAEVADQWAKILLENINQTIIEYEDIQLSQTHNTCSIELPTLLGGATTHGRQTSQALLSAADMALQRARKSAKHYYIHQDTFSPVLNDNHAWRAAILRIIESPAQCMNAILQPVFDKEGNILHQEAFIQLKLNEQWVMAEDWLPMVEAVGLSVQLDMAVISYLAQQQADKAVAINISMLSVHSHDFIRYLQQAKFLHQHLILEVSESALLMNIERAKFFIQHIENSGWRWGLDQFGRIAEKGNYLAQFKPEYIKLDYSYTRCIDASADMMARNVVISLCRLIYQCSLYAIATRVESLEQKQQLAQLSLNGFQGFGICVSQKETTQLSYQLSKYEE